MTQSSCKRDTKSKSHPSVKLAPVRVFSCKHPLIFNRAALPGDSVAQSFSNRWNYLQDVTHDLFLLVLGRKFHTEAASCLVFFFRECYFLEAERGPWGRGCIRMYLVLQRDFRLYLYFETCHATHLVLSDRLGSNGFEIIFSDKFGINNYRATQKLILMQCVNFVILSPRAVFFLSLCRLKVGHFL